MADRSDAVFKTARAIECVVLFLAAPAVLAEFMRRWMLFPAIWALGALCLVLLLTDPTFNRRRLWNLRGAERHWSLMLGLGVVGAAVLTAILWVYAPGSHFGLPRNYPTRWALIMVLYPVLSVYPQEIAFRAFFMHRYHALFGRGAGMVLASAAAFGWAHLVMRNGWAMGFSAIGGVLFGVTYLRTRSLAAACLEHAWYGWVLFTVGWGPWFYHGTFG
jgi:membrane protease YdiL (CAAX protease family)